MFSLTEADDAAYKPCGRLAYHTRLPHTCTHTYIHTSYIHTNTYVPTHFKGGMAVYHFHVLPVPARSGALEDADLRIVHTNRLTERPILCNTYTHTYIHIHEKIQHIHTYWQYRSHTYMLILHVNVAYQKQKWLTGASASACSRTLPRNLLIACNLACTLAPATL